MQAQLSPLNGVLCHLGEVGGGGKSEFHPLTEMIEPKGRKPMKKNILFLLLMVILLTVQGCREKVPATETNQPVTPRGTAINSIEPSPQSSPQEEGENNRLVAPSPTSEEDVSSLRAVEPNPTQTQPVGEPVATPYGGDNLKESISTGVVGFTQNVVFFISGFNSLKCFPFSFSGEALPNITSYEKNDLATVCIYGLNPGDPINVKIINPNGRVLEEKNYIVPPDAGELSLELILNFERRRPGKWKMVATAPDHRFTETFIVEQEDTPHLFTRLGDLEHPIIVEDFSAHLERDDFIPGEPVQVAGTGFPENARLAVGLYYETNPGTPGSNAQLVETYPVDSNEYGYFTLDLNMDASKPQGAYLVVLPLSPDYQPIESTSKDGAFTRFWYQPVPPTPTPEPVPPSEGNLLARPELRPYVLKHEWRLETDTEIELLPMVLEPHASLVQPDSLQAMLQVDQLQELPTRCLTLTCQLERTAYSYAWIDPGTKEIVGLTYSLQEWETDAEASAHSDELRKTAFEAGSREMSLESASLPAGSWAVLAQDKTSVALVVPYGRFIIHATLQLPADMDPGQGLQTLVDFAILQIQQIG